MAGRRASILTALCVAASSLALTAVPRADGVGSSPGPVTSGISGILGISGTSASTAGLAPYVVLLREPRRGQQRSVPALAQSLTAELGGFLTHTYDTALDGFAARLPDAAVAALRQDPRVASVSPDTAVSVDRTQRGPIWNLDRIDQSGRALDRRFRYPDRAGAGVHVYVIDTGLSGHTELSGRIGAGRNFVGSLLFGPDPAAWADCEGHGTHVASTAAGTTWGIAKRAIVHGIRVLDCSGSGTTSEVLAGVDYVAANHQSPAVVNMSLSNTSRTPALDAAVAGLVRRGVAVAVAAGNSGGDACRESPSAAPEVLTVAATNRSDARAGFSNFGSCVDLFAPGVDVLGARVGGGGFPLSGTSMSAPHVAGALALVRADNPRLGAVAAQRRVVAAATRGVVGDLGAGSPDRLLRVFADEAPRARFTVRCEGRRCTFDARASSDDTEVRGFRWRFGRSTARGPVVTRSFAGRQKRTAVLTVLDEYGQPDQARRGFTPGR